MLVLMDKFLPPFHETGKTEIFKPEKALLMLYFPFARLVMLYGSYEYLRLHRASLDNFHVFVDPVV